MTQTICQHLFKQFLFYQGFQCSVCFIMSNIKSINYDINIFHIMINTKYLLLISILIFVSQSVYLPLVPRRPRCMMVYTVSAGESQSVKIYLDLPQLNNQQQGEFYAFSLKNTQTNEVKNESIQFGTFSRQYDLSPNIIYQVCIQVISNRQIQNIVIYYKAETVYNIEHSQLKVPDNLLKKQDFKGAYQATYHIEKTVEDYKIMQSKRDVTSNEQFVSTKAVDQNLITISIVEILIVMAAGIYQFISLKNYLVSKQYI